MFCSCTVQLIALRNVLRSFGLAPGELQKWRKSCLPFTNSTRPNLCKIFSKSGFFDYHISVICNSFFLSLRWSLNDSYFQNVPKVIEGTSLRGDSSGVCSRLSNKQRPWLLQQRKNDFPPNWNPKCCMLLQIVCQVIYRIVGKHLWSTGHLFQIQRLWSNKKQFGEQCRIGLRFFSSKISNSIHAKGMPKLWNLGICKSMCVSLFKATLLRSEQVAPCKLLWVPPSGLAPCT